MILFLVCKERSLPSGDLSRKTLWRYGVTFSGVLVGVGCPFSLSSASARRLPMGSGLSSPVFYGLTDSFLLFGTDISRCVFVRVEVGPVGGSSSTYCPTGGVTTIAWQESGFFRGTGPCWGALFPWGTFESERLPVLT